MCKYHTLSWKKYTNINNNNGWAHHRRRHHQAIDMQLICTFYQEHSVKELSNVFRISSATTTIDIQTFLLATCVTRMTHSSYINCEALGIRGPRLPRIASLQLIRSTCYRAETYIYTRIVWSVAHMEKCHPLVLPRALTKHPFIRGNVAQRYCHSNGAHSVCECTATEKTAASHSRQMQWRGWEMSLKKMK